MAYQSQYWDAYYRSEGDSIDSGVSYFSYTDSDVILTDVYFPGVNVDTPEKFKGVASALFSEFEGSSPAKVQNVSGGSDDELDKEMIAYSVKVIRPRTGTHVETLTMKKFGSVDEFRSRLQSEFFDDESFNFGYIKCGHGMNGRQVQIVNESDLVDMYEDYRSSCKHINMRAKSRPVHKRSQSEVKDPEKHKDEAEGSSTKKKKTSGSYQSHLDKMTEVELILEELEKHHGESKFTAEQLRVWAHLLHMKKHESYDRPPNKPFFQQPKAIQKLAGNSSTESGMSPAKKIHVRTELIKQLEKWHSLMERGAISQEQFQSMKDTIIIDIKNY